MRVFLACVSASVCASAWILASGISIASAQCYGDAAQAFGCGVSRASEGTLSRFGDEPTEVLPDYGTSRTMSVDDLFTPQEQRQMYKALVMRRGQLQRSNNTLYRTMEANQRPLRPSGNLPFPNFWRSNQF